MVKYYYQTIDDETIRLLGTGKKVPHREGYYEITKEQYDSYMATLASIEQREGYYSIVTLYISGAYDVSYVPWN